MRPLAWIISATLASAAAWLWLNNKDQNRTPQRRRSADPPVEALAEQLQHAWADHHTST